MDPVPLTIGGSGLWSQETASTVLFVILGGGDGIPFAVL